METLQLLHRTIPFLLLFFSHLSSRLRRILEAWGEYPGGQSYLCIPRDADTPFWINPSCPSFRLAQMQLLPQPAWKGKQY